MYKNLQVYQKKVPLYLKAQAIEAALNFYTFC